MIPKKQMRQIDYMTTSAEELKTRHKTNECKQQSEHTKAVMIDNYEQCGMRKNTFLSMVFIKWQCSLPNENQCFNNQVKLVNCFEMIWPYAPKESYEIQTTQ